MQSALSSLVDDKHNNQELEDELADLLNKDMPPISSAKKQNVLGNLFILTQ